jgi:two-component system, cell cycle response regulator DivK
VATPQKHVLIVDDSEDDRILFAQFLTRKGYRVSKARDGRDGLGKAFELQPHLVLMDLWLPILSGWDVMKQLRADERTRHIAILAVTSHTMVPPPECDGLIEKPCLLEDLAGEIARILEARDQRTSPSPESDHIPPPEDR